MSPLSPWWPLIRRRTITFLPITSARTWAFATPRCISSTFTTTQTTSCWRASRLSRTFSRFSTTESLVSKWNAGKTKHYCTLTNCARAAKGPPLNTGLSGSPQTSSSSWVEERQPKTGNGALGTKVSQPNGYCLWYNGSCSLRRVRELTELLFLAIKIRV